MVSVRVWLPGCAIVLACGCGTASDEAAPVAATPPATATTASQAAPPARAGTPAAVSPEPTAAIGGTQENIKENKILRLGITEAGFGPAGRTAPPGRRYYIVGLRGMSKSDSAHAVLGQTKGNDVHVDVRRFVYAQNDRGCISRPERDMPELDRPIGDAITFPALQNKSGQLAFLVPDDTRRVRILIAPGGDDGLVVPAGEDFTPSWPAPLHTIADGSTLRVLVLPNSAPPPGLPPPPAGREHVLVDVVVLNLKDTSGVEFQPSQQFRLVDPTGRFVQQSPATSQLGCHMPDSDVIPPGHARRMLAVFDFPAGAPLRLQYRGFEKDETVVEIKR